MKATIDKVASSFIHCKKQDQFKNVDSCKQKKCSNKCDEFHKYEHGSQGAIGD